MTLELVAVPVSDVDRAKAFSSEQLGFTVDHDIGDPDGPGMRLVQLTPPGSACSIVIGRGFSADAMTPGSVRGLQLVVPDIRAAREELLGRGVEVGDVQVLGENPFPAPDPWDYVGFLFFTDPDGNGWAVQQMSSRAT